ncbi:MAG: alpha-isopropylmalate synthase regulatory domain-containing protein [Spirochaetota bacterium]
MLNFEIKDATKILGIARALTTYAPPFRITDSYRLIDNGIEPEATVQIEADGRFIHEAANGAGPVDALAKVLKKALLPLFPFLEKIDLIDYHAEIIDANLGTATSVMVSIIFTNGTEVWKGYATSENINLASFHVLVDGLEYAILRHMQEHPAQ